jgi:hypothetical protein
MGAMCKRRWKAICYRRAKSITRRSIYYQQTDLNNEYLLAHDTFCHDDGSLVLYNTCIYILCMSLALYSLVIT